MRLRSALILFAMLSHPAAVFPADTPDKDGKPDIAIVGFEVGPAPAPGLLSSRPEDFKWTSPPGAPDLRVAWVIGSETGKGPYALRVRIAAGGKIARHTHPDTRIVTVLSGKLRAEIDYEKNVTTITEFAAGSVYIMPAGAPHAVAAVGGDVEYQEDGFGPTGTEFLKP